MNLKQKLIIALLISISSFSFAQNSDQKALRKAFISNNLNAGVSLGFGGAKPFGFAPIATFKLGRLNISGIGWDKYRTYTYTDGGIEATLDVFELKGSPTNRTYFTIGAGQAKYSRIFEENEYLNYAYWQLGINRYYLNKRSSISFAIGFSHFRRIKEIYSSENFTTYNGPVLYQNFVPYLSASYNWYLAKFRPKTWFDWHSQKFVLRNGNMRQQQMPETKIKSKNNRSFPLFSQYFNPRLSLGVGATHPSLIFPNIGVKIDRLDLGIGLGIDTWHDITASFNFDIDALSLKNDNQWLTAGASLNYLYWASFASLHLGIKKYKPQSAWSLKAGIGMHEEFDFPFPTIDASYHLYVFRFN